MVTRPQIGLPVTRFIGRDELVAHAVELVTEQRLVSLTGPGGIGKTRLSLELGERLSDHFADGVVVTALDVVTDPADVVWRAASALEIADLSSGTPSEQLTRFLADKSMLLVLDNCEHLLEAAAELATTILTSCPGVHLLTTSREPLGVQGEHVLTVPPLDLPERGADLAEIAASEAVVLLLERAQQAGSTVRLGPETAEAVVELCHRLDGMPLALELAAVRLRSLSPGEVLARLDSRFQLLRGGRRGSIPRHKTLHALVDWSHELCTPAEQLLWSRLSVFNSGCDLEAAEMVTGFGELAAEDVLDLLDALVGKSIVIAETDELGVHFRMLVTIRDYGAELAEAQGETEVLRRRHRDLYLTRARAMVRHWTGPDQQHQLAAVRRAHPDVIAALEWSLAHPEEVDAAAELAALLRFHWVSGRYLIAGRHRLQQVLATPGISGPRRAEVLWVLAWVLLISGRHDEAEECLRPAAAYAADSSDEGLRAQVHNWTGLLQLFRGDARAAVSNLRRADEIFTGLGDLSALCTALFQRALAEVYGASPSAALRTCDRLISWSTRTGDTWFKAYACWIRGIALWRDGEISGARDSVVEALKIQRSNLDGIGIAHTLVLSSSIALAHQDPRRALRLQGLADGLWRTLGTDVDAFGPDLARDSEQTRRRAIEAVGRTEAEAELAAVSATAGVDRDAVAAGIELLESLSQNRSLGLTRRETEIANLVAEGLANREIAEALTISTRTVDGHVEKIFHKLQVRSRTQVALKIRSLDSGGSH